MYCGMMVPHFRLGIRNIVIAVWLVMHGYKTCSQALNHYLQVTVYKLSWSLLLPYLFTDVHDVWTRCQFILNVQKYVVTLMILV